MTPQQVRSRKSAHKLLIREARKALECRTVDLFKIAVGTEDEGFTALKLYKQWRRRELLPVMIESFLIDVLANRLTPRKARKRP